MFTRDVWRPATMKATVKSHLGKGAMNGTPEYTSHDNYKFNLLWTQTIYRPDDISSKLLVAFRNKTKIF